MNLLSNQRYYCTTVHRQLIASTPLLHFRSPTTHCIICEKDILE